MIPLVQIILSLVGSLFGAKLLGLFKIDPAATGGANVPASVSVLSDHPAAAASPTAPSPTKTPAPALKQIISDTVNQPYSVWGLAALGLVAVPFIGQLRAAGHEIGGAAGDVYREGQAQNRALNDTTRRSRRDRR